MTNKFIQNVVNEIKPQKKEKLEEKMLLNEELVPAEISELNIEMDNNPDLKQLLYTKAVDLPEKYKYLVGEIYEDYEDVCLYDLILQSQKNLGKIKFSFQGQNKDWLVGRLMKQIS